MYRYLIVALVVTGCASSGSTFTRPADCRHQAISYDQPHRMER